MLLSEGTIEYLYFFRQRFTDYENFRCEHSPSDEKDATFFKEILDVIFHERFTASHNHHSSFGHTICNDWLAFCDGYYYSIYMVIYALSFIKDVCYHHRFKGGNPIFSFSDANGFRKFYRLELSSIERWRCTASQ